MRPFKRLQSDAEYTLLWPAPVDSILHYWVLLKQRGLAVGSVKQQVSALAFASKSLGYQEFTGDFRVCRRLEGWQREVGKESPHQGSCRPLLLAVLKALQAVWAKICTLAYEGCLFHAASLLVFLGELRVSENTELKCDTSGRH